MIDRLSHERMTTESVEKPDAIHGLGEYLYHAITAAMAWVSQSEDATPFLDILGYFSKLGKNTLFAHQVKASRRTLTLIDSSVKAMIENFIQLAANNPTIEAQQYRARYLDREFKLCLARVAGPDVNEGSGHE